MTTNSENDNSRWAYDGNGSTVDFAYDNKIFADSDLDVYVDGVLQTLTTDFTVSNAGVSDGGNVTFVTAPADGTEVVIVRDVEATQQSDYVDGEDFPADTIEDDFDRAIICIQQLIDDISRTIRLADSDATENLSPLPALAARASMYLAFDADGDLTVAAGTADATPHTAFGASVAATDDAAALRTLLGLGALALLSSVGLSNMADAAKEFTIPFQAGYAADQTGTDVAVQTYMEYLVTVPFTLIDDDGDAGTAPTGQAAILDIEKNGTTVYDTKPQFAAAATTLTGGTLKSDGTQTFAAGDKITFKVTQVGSSVAGQKFLFSLKARMT